MAPGAEHDTCYLDRRKPKRLKLENVDGRVDRAEMRQGGFVIYREDCQRTDAIGLWSLKGNVIIS